MVILKRRNIPVIDIIWGFMPATVFCLRHFKFWREGDDFEEYGGKACKKCIVQNDAQ